jgi:hypothetical protein
MLRTQPTLSSSLAPHTRYRLMMWAQCVALVAMVGFVASACDEDPDSTTSADTSTTSADTSTTSADTSGADSDVTTADTSGGGDGSDGVNPTTPPRFAFGINPAQTISAAPFPNNLYLSGDKITLAPLGADPVVGTLGKAESLTTYDGYIADRHGFSFAAPVFFFTEGFDTAQVDEETLKGHIRIITLSGPEAGREVNAQGFWAKYPKAVGVMADWGDYTMADSTYGVILTAGVTAGGEALPQSPGIDAVLAADAPADANEDVLGARATYAPLRDWMSANSVNPADVLVATVFSTEPVLDYAESLLSAVDAFPLTPITDRTRYDVAAGAFAQVEQATDPAAVEARMGVPEAPLLYYPAYTYPEARELAAQLPGGQAYTGGILHTGIGAIYTGSFEAPAFNLTVSGDEVINSALQIENGAPTYTHTTLVPFSLYLCEQHLADPSNLPVAVFTHGGGETRIDGVAMANLNCKSGVATIAADIVFHGTRGDLVTLSTGQLIAPTGVDLVNGYIGKAEGDPGYQSDFISEGLGATGSVGRLFAIGSSLDPLVVEANIITISAENHLLARYLKAGDWSGLVPNLSFDPDNIFHQSLSFGASFTTLDVALRDDFKGVVTSVASGMILPSLAMSPSNSESGALLAWLFLGLDKSSTLQELKAGSYKDWMLGMHLWLYERADPIAYAPYVLRHRPSDRPMSVIGTGDSWDETLYNSLQLSYAAAYGIKTYHDGDKWRLDPTVPGAASIQADPLSGDATVSGNVTLAGVTHTAVNFFRDSSCHSQLVNNFCVQSYAHPYPPITPLDTRIVQLSHICEIHTQIKGFTDSLLSGAPLATVSAPSGDCATLYGSP